MTLKQQEGIIQLKFDDFPSFFHCSIIFLVEPYNRKVFLHILSEPDECFGYRVRVYNDYVLIPSNELTPRTRNFCTKSADRTSIQNYPRSFVTSTRYFTIQVEYKCIEKLFRPLEFKLYYQPYINEEELFKGEYTMFHFPFYIIFYFSSVYFSNLEKLTFSIKESLNAYLHFNCSLTNSQIYWPN